MGKVVGTAIATAFLALLLLLPSFQHIVAGLVDFVVWMGGNPP